MYIYIYIYIYCFSTAAMVVRTSLNVALWPVLFIKQCSLRFVKLSSIITTVGRLTVCCATISPYQYHISDVSCNFFLQLLGPATSLSRNILQDVTTARRFLFFVACIVRTFAVKIEKLHTFYLFIEWYKNSVQEGKFQLPAVFSKENSSCVATI